VNKYAGAVDFFSGINNKPTISRLAFLYFGAKYPVNIFKGSHKRTAGKIFMEHVQIIYNRRWIVKIPSP